MTLHNTPWMGETEDILADLADAAYQVLLRHGMRGSFLEAELELWHQLRSTYYRQTVAAVLDQVDLGRPAPLPVLAEVDSW
jgi:hypothetical protein